MKDGTRWKLDPIINQTKKLNLAVDFEKVVRFECIFLPQINLEVELASNLSELSRELTSVADQGMSQIGDCFCNLTKVHIAEDDI